MFLTAGITLGSWWAYYRNWAGAAGGSGTRSKTPRLCLGSWQPRYPLTRRNQRGAFRAWTVLLAIFGFSLSLLGTFLVRSGVLVSIHAFATDPERGLFILIFLGIVVGGAHPICVAGNERFGRWSVSICYPVETLLLMNNVLLVVACFAVLYGTMRPLIADALSLGKSSVGKPYFDAVFVPLMLPLAFLLGIGPLVQWKKDNGGGTCPAACGNAGRGARAGCVRHRDR